MTMAWVRGRYSVPARKFGLVQTKEGYLGTITFASEILYVRLDGEINSRMYHPSDLTYFTKEEAKEIRQMQAIHEALEGILNPKGDGSMIVTHGFGEDLKIAPHGHVTRRADAFKAKCGGLQSCLHCQEEQRRYERGTWPYDRAKVLTFTMMKDASNGPIKDHPV
jgi:hypothetical protein